MVRPFRNRVKIQQLHAGCLIVNIVRFCSERHAPGNKDSEANGMTDTLNVHRGARGESGNSTERDDLTTRLLSRFKELLQNGVLVPGDRLPSERVLAEQFGVSRSSLRQAFKMLDIMGILSQRVGD